LPVAIGRRGTEASLGRGALSVKKRLFNAFGSRGGSSRLAARKKTKNTDRTDYVYENKGKHDAMTENQPGFLTETAHFWRKMGGSRPHPNPNGEFASPWGAERRRQKAG
jgi:hypothetical protein